MSDKDKCKMEFTRDENGEEILLKDGQFQVMMEWERPYMEACIEALHPHGDVLEIGFGCGYSATAIQRYPIKSHTIIEYHPVVFAKAQEWAKDKKNVILIHDTWQNALPKLGIFDAVFFDDYPLENAAQTQEAERMGQKAKSLLAKGRKLIEKIEKQFSFLKEMRYGDEDLDYFFNHLNRKHKNPAAHYLRFFHDLRRKGNISPEQLQKIHARLIAEKLVTPGEIEDYQKAHPDQAAPLRKTHDRFFTFLDAILKSHTRQGSKISCFIEDPTSKYEDQRFIEAIIANPFLDYQERRMPIKVSDKCRYYKGEEALIITITKQ